VKSKAIGVLKWIGVTVAVGLVTVLGVRAWDAQRGAPLDLWHTYVPPEMTAGQISGADWASYLAAEQRVVDAVRREVTDRLPPEARHAANRYYAGSPMHPDRFPQDWNRSFELAPEGAAAGAVVLLHGLTDSPYSMRNLARRYRDHGFVAVAIRLPGHGTVPAGLTGVHWEQWSEATRLAVREARRRAAPGAPLHLVGYSNGGALAMKYALDALDDPSLPRPARIVLVSPMIGVTALARFAGILGWPAVFPAFAGAAWLGIVPEFNPFKYNSFPVNGARQSSLVARSLQAQIARRAREGGLAELPPILTFQSVVDFTVSTRAIVDALYAQLPANGSELVLFDLNRSARFGPLLSESDAVDADRLLPAAPRRYRTAILTNAGAGRNEVIERVTGAGATSSGDRQLALAWPDDVFSLSHIALPFPLDDPLYGMRPSPAESFGVTIGAIAPRGERGALVVSVESLSRMASNPFFAYLLARVDEVTARPAPGAPARQ
jgi:alpha-beta hydrolase superfamily lysophospholipase